MVDYKFGLLYSRAAVDLQFVRLRQGLHCDTTVLGAAANRGWRPDAAQMEALLRGISRQNTDSTNFLLIELLQYGSPEQVIPRLRQILEWHDLEDILWRMTVRTLGALRDVRCLPVLQGLHRDTRAHHTPLLRLVVLADALGAIGGDTAAEVICEIWRDQMHIFTDGLLYHFAAQLLCALAATRAAAAERLLREIVPDPRLGPLFQQCAALELLHNFPANDANITAVLQIWQSIRHSPTLQSGALKERLQQCAPEALALLKSLKATTT